MAKRTSLTPGDDTWALDSLRYYAKFLVSSADNVLSYAKQVQYKRPFETRAEEELDNAEKALTHALESIRNARERYKALV